MSIITPNAFRFPIKDLITSDCCVIESDKDKLMHLIECFTVNNVPDFSINVDPPILNEVPITPKIVHAK